LLQARRPDTIRSPLEFLNLLERDAERIGNVRLAHLQGNSAATYLLPDVDIYRSTRSPGTAVFIDSTATALP
jgi:hypothetical protein